MKLEVKVANIESVVTRMDSKIDDILKEQNNARTENVSRKELESELKRIETAIENTKKRHTVTVWITTSLATIVSIVMTLLVTYFITNIGG